MQFRTRRLALISALLLSASAEGAIAGEAWRIVDTAGTVRAGGAGFMPVALNRNQVLPSDAWVETATDGRVVLARGNETIVVQPNSRVMLPEREVDGNTQVLQTLGSALYKIGKQKKPHFQVDTPYLAAVVKGTEFTVAVNGGEASVMVSEGLVEVATPNRSDVEFVKPGFTATVTAGAHGDVVVDQTPADDHAKTNAGHGNDAANDKEKDNGKSDKAAAAHGPVVIPVALGDVTIDVKEVSGGLAHGEIKTAAIEAGKDKASTESDAGGKDNGKPAGDSADVGGAIESADAPKLNGGHQSVDVVAAPDLGSDNAAPNLGGNNGNGNGAGNGSGNGAGNGAAPDVGGGPIVDIVPDLGGSNGNGGNGNSGGGNGNGGGKANGGGKGKAN